MRRRGPQEPLKPPTHTAVPSETAQLLSMCQYAILASLLQQPRSGYDIARWFADVTSHFWTVGHSAVYPALADLTRRALVVYEQTPSDKGPARKVYHLNAVGRETLLTWASQPAAEADVRDEQLLKALCYGFVPQDTALALISAARARHEQRKRQFEDFVRQADLLMARAQEAGDQDGFRAALGQRLTARRGVGAQACYLAWCDEVVAVLSALPQL
ncbi:MAG TPA: PadR family transcriptional regulator [Ktedonobacterales bacterium]